MPMSDLEAMKLMEEYIKNKEQAKRLNESPNKTLDEIFAKDDLIRKNYNYERNSQDLNEAAETRQKINEMLENNSIKPKSVLSKAQHLERGQDIFKSLPNESKMLEYDKNAHLGALEDQGIQLEKRLSSRSGRSPLQELRVKGIKPGEVGASTPQALLEMLAIEAGIKALGAPELASQSPQELSVEDPNSPEFKRRRVMVDALAEIKRQNQK